MQGFQNHFLIAMPSLDDPMFKRSVTYLCEHNEEGAMGIVVNHPMNVSLAELLEQLEISYDAKSPAAQAKVVSRIIF